jgi:lipoprotein-anchoring transpeptidase ErfK/SrfK
MKECLTSLTAPQTDCSPNRSLGVARRRIAGVSLVLAVASVGSLSTMAPAGAQATTKPPTTKPSTNTTTTNPARPTNDAKGSLVAATKSGKKGATINVYKAANGKSIQTKVKNPLSSRAVFSVVAESGDYYQVLLPVRPNSSRGWIKKSDVTTYRTPFRVVISLGEKRLAVYEGDTLIVASNIAIGKPSTPTPTGEFYLYWVRRTNAKQRPGWGEYVLGLSGFGNNRNYGEGRVGIHGTDNTSSIGTFASAGCVRVTNEVIRQLKSTLYLGTPVTIVA